MAGGGVAAAGSAPAGGALAAAACAAALAALAALSAAAPGAPALPGVAAVAGAAASSDGARSGKAASSGSGGALSAAGVGTGGRDGGGAASGVRFGSAMCSWAVISEGSVLGGRGRGAPMRVPSQSIATRCSASVSAPRMSRRRRRKREETIVMAASLTGSAAARPIAHFWRSAGRHAGNVVKKLETAPIYLLRYSHTSQETTMSNPQMPNIPGAAVMTDTLDFVKNLWGSMSVPGLTAPTLSVDELDKKINDLKAVEAWLNLNMSMLRGSIQALEVQRGTIATLKSVGASMAAAVNQGSDHKSLFESVPYASAFFHHATPAAAKPAPAAAAAPAAPPPAAAPAKPPVDDAATAASNAAAAQMANPTVWWNLLQDQFKQAVSTAMTSDAVSGAAARATDAAAKFAAAASGKPAPKAASVAKPASAKAAVKKAPVKRAAPKTKA